MELCCHPQEGDDQEEAGNVLIASHMRDEGAQDQGYPEQGLAQAAGAAARDPSVDVPKGTAGDPAYAPEGTHRDPAYAPMSGGSSTMSLASPRPPPPVQAGWREAVIGGRGMEYPLSQCHPHQHHTLLLPLLYKLLQVSI